MNHQEKEVIIERAKEWMRSNLISSHIKNTEKLTLDNFSINPFLWPYLSNFYKGETNSRALAEVLVLPRILGTSINTTFGSHTQQFIATLFSDESFGSAVQGIDIEFIDAVDGRRKYCQLKAGPNAINKDDVATITGHFSAVKNLARQNSLPVQVNDLVLGILYGEEDEMNANIKKVSEEFPVYAGAEFWHRFTGDEGFYEDLAIAMAEVANEVDSREIIENAIEKISDQIELRYPELISSSKVSK